MADRRMFTKKVTDDDNFVSLSSSAQALYLHLAMSADDDGFSNQITISMFRAHASTQDLQALLEKRYIYQFKNGVIVIKHWRMANALRKDRYTPTTFQEEYKQLNLKDNGSYTMIEPALLDDNANKHPTTRQQAYESSTLPYSFDYKIKNAFWGKPCPICGNLMSVTVDECGVQSDSRIPSIQHNIPISKGGKHELGNISVICKQCNISIQDNETEELNSKEVIEEWEKINGCRLVANCLPQDRLDKDRLDKNRLDKDIYTSRFDEFWKAYPKKTGKGAAIKSWEKIKPNEELFSKIMTSLEAHKSCQQWTKQSGQFIPNPATWLNQMRWEDEVDVSTGGNIFFEVANEC